MTKFLHSVNNAALKRFCKFRVDALLNARVTAVHGCVGWLDDFWRHANQTLGPSSGGWEESGGVKMFPPTFLLANQLSGGAFPLDPWVRFGVQCVLGVGSGQALFTAAG